MPEKPKSAPARIYSKKSFTKTNAIKEMEAWVRGNSNSIGTAFEGTVRGSGQLSENVTEERMLKARLWELSKERYKFIAQKEYEKKMFLDKIQRKAIAMRRRSVRSETSGKCSTKDDVKSTTSRMTHHEQPIIPVTIDSDIGALKTALPTKNVQFIPSVTVNNSSTKQKVFSTQPDRIQARGLRLPDVNGKMTKSAGSVGYQNRLRNNVSASSFRTSWSRNSNRSSKFGEQLVGYTDDPRYYQLENVLSLKYESRSNIEVMTVVQRLDALHVLPKNLKEKKPKLEAKVQQFMRENGIVF